MAVLFDFFAFNYNVVKQVKELECKLKEQAHSENVAAQKVVLSTNTRFFSPAFNSLINNTFQMFTG